MEEQRKLEDTRLAEGTALAMAEREKVKCMAAMKSAETSRKIAELEAQKRISVESEHKKKNVDILSHSPVRYRKYTIEEAVQMRRRILGRRSFLSEEEEEAFSKMNSDSYE